MGVGIVVKRGCCGRDGVIFELVGGSRIGDCCNCIFTKLFLATLSLVGLLILLGSFINTWVALDDDGHALAAIVGTIFGAFPIALLLNIPFGC